MSQEHDQTSQAPTALPPLLSVRQACLMLGIGRTTLYGLLGDESIEPCKIKRRTLIRRDDVLAYIDQLRKP